MATLDDLAAFDMSRERGFLPAVDPLQELPERFSAWEEVAAELPRLIPSGRLRAVLEHLPVVPLDELEDDAALRRAMLLLSFLGHAYVWGEPVPARILPARLAVPWSVVAGRLGRPPVLSYASYALENWRRFDPDAPLELGGFAVLQNFLGGVDEDWFITVHIEIEVRAARFLSRIGPLLGAVAKSDEDAAAELLEEVASAVQSLVAALQRMPEYCDPYIYYRRVRPFIHGWSEHPALPEGLIYEGVERFGGRPQRFRGETGAQSAIVPTLDALLGVRHAEDPLSRYLLEMRTYMPPRHRMFLSAVEAAGPVRPFVEARGGDCSELLIAYNECIGWLEAFRGAHLDFATRYIHRQQEAGSANPTATGTGGTPFMEYLKKHRDETAAHRL